MINTYMAKLSLLKSIGSQLLPGVRKGQLVTRIFLVTFTSRWKAQFGSTSLTICRVLMHGPFTNSNAGEKGKQGNTPGGPNYQDAGCITPLST